ASGTLSARRLPLVALHLQEVAHVFDAVGGPGELLRFDLLVFSAHEAGEGHYALNGVDVDVHGGHLGVGGELGFDLGGNTRVGHLSSHRPLTNVDLVDHPLDPVGVPGDLLGFAAIALALDHARQPHHTIVGVDVDLKGIDLRIRRELRFDFAGDPAVGHL